MSDFPVQGKLRIRPANAEQDIQFIRAHVGELSEPELRSMPGYDFLKFWYADFACTDQQWAALAPELDQRNVLATLYEAPVFAAEVAAPEAGGQGRTSSSLVPRVLNLCALFVALAASGLMFTSMIDGVACGVAGAAAIGLVAAGQMYGRAQG